MSTQGFTDFRFFLLVILFELNMLYRRTVSVFSCLHFWMGVNRFVFKLNLIFQAETSNLTSLVALTFTMLRDVKSWLVIVPLCFHKCTTPL